MLTLVIGGARSGKSRFAQSLAGKFTKVAYIATCRAEDAEMVERVARHRLHRPKHWTTIEAPVEIAAAVRKSSPHYEVLLLDCLTIWLSNFCYEHRELPPADLEAVALRELTGALEAARDTELIVVTNEVGCGLVPESAVARLFRDVHGWLNQEAARRADFVYHTVAGIAVAIKRPEVSR
jgi:adenosylcobinamide kinase/adenosylcobinamide-phosphate guanylyltransferase